MYARRLLLSALLMPFVAVTAQAINKKTFYGPTTDSPAPASAPAPAPAPAPAAATAIPTADWDRLREMVFEGRLLAAAEEKGGFYMPKEAVACRRPSRTATG